MSHLPYQAPPPPKSRRTLWIVLGLLGAVTLLGCFGGCAVLVVSAADSPAQRASAPPASAPTGQIAAKVGQTITVLPRHLDEDCEVRYSLSNVRRVKPTLAAPENGMYVSATLSVKVIKGTEWASDSDLSFVTAGGTVYHTTYAGFENEFEPVELREGQRKVGLVVFDVPTDALSGGRIQLNSLFDDEPYGYWTL
ncbi:hypothetical protein HH310_14250 [Actinoplanes sp. TBRC 11911]|uniref:hypothetical protein n=1 Tax=Actinoplanes sp. TBRC 11911 TaxID=2729386 RepID=UPI00145E47D3|nr:hypothetical protein [Actinoplanes sp. TBRC 11911]NMO52354.1 hypothetical protein [Actinoplanes sp. TBRC 11911]